MPQVTRWPGGQKRVEANHKTVVCFAWQWNICITGGGALGAWNPYGGANQARVEMVDHLGLLEPEVIEIKEQC